LRAGSISRKLTALSCKVAMEVQLSPEKQAKLQDWVNVPKWAGREDALFLSSFPTALYTVGYRYGRFS
jgi:hypothetical protein